VAKQNETRAAERVKVEAFVKIVGGDKEFVFRTRDLSKNGVFLYTRVAHIYPFKIGSTLTLELYDYDEFVTAKVVIVRVVEPNSAEADRYPTGFGVKIIEVDDANRQRLGRMIERASAGAELY
jgi:hypothetical protein